MHWRRASAQLPLAVACTCDVCAWLGSVRAAVALSVSARACGLLGSANRCRMSTCICVVSMVDYAVLARLRRCSQVLGGKGRRVWSSRLAGERGGRQ